MALEEEHVLELALGELVLLVQLALLHLPRGRLPRAHQLLLLLQELPVQQGDLLPVRVREAPQGRLVGLVQLRQEVTLLKWGAEISEYDRLGREIEGNWHPVVAIYET